MDNETTTDTGNAVVATALGVCTVIGAYHVSKFVARKTAKVSVKIVKKPFTRRKK